MSNLEQVKAQIRFGLSQLAETNSHHEFEHLCRHLSRARICSNIIPATGPVSSGGDQGRDFETFKSYISSDPSEGTTFVGLISDKSIVFACSMQKENIQNKIKSDLKKIIDSGSQVESIYFFLTSGIPISQNHKLKDWAKENYSISFEIVDGQAISELLADREVFWIAEQYLGIPSEIFPRAFDEKDWYQKSLNKWKSLESPNYNFADFHEVKTATRHATFSKDSNQDILFWIGTLEKFRKKEFSGLWRKSVYEISVAKLRGLGTLEKEENYIREYFSEISNLDRSVDLEDANNLLTYCITAYFRNLVMLKPEELDSWHDELTQKVDELLSNTEKPGYKCSLLEIRGSISLYIINPITGNPFTQFDIENAIEWWMELADNVKDAPLFPLKRFADRLTDLIYLIGSSPKYGQLSQKIDIVLSERYGNFVAAEKCRDRAIQFYNIKNILKAINQVHQSKVKWFSEETLKGSIISILQISEWYKELNLVFAAKYYSLAAAFISSNSSDPLIISYLPKALVHAAECDYLQGSWLSYLHLSDIGFRSHCVFSPDVGDLEKDEVFERILFHTTTLISITKQIDPQLFEFVMTFVARWNIEDCLEENIIISQKYWSEKSLSEVWEILEDNLLGRPFEDVGNLREVMWSELGIIWRVKWDNDYSTTSLCEQFIAVLQILLADLAEIDLCLMKTEVNIVIVFNEVSSPNIKSKASNSIRYWEITLPLYTTKSMNAYETLEHYIVSFASHILFEVSLLPEAKFHEVIESSFKNGLSMKLFVGQTYEFLYRYFIDENFFNKTLLNGLQVPLPSHKFSFKNSEKLPWFNGPIPGYSKEIAEEYLRTRYSNVILPIEFTLKRLVKNQQFISTLNKLRSDGWLDWHILAAICMITVNYRVNSQTKPYIDVVEINKLFKYYLFKSESEFDSNVPISEFAEENIQRSLKVNMLSTIKFLGLECHQVTPNFDGIEHFLRHRCNYWDDDIEHDDPFDIDLKIE